MKKNNLKKTGLFSKMLNKYSIRKFSIGTASIILGAIFFLGNDAKAAESTIETQTATTTEEIQIQQEPIVEDVTNPTPQVIEQAEDITTTQEITNVIESSEETITTPEISVTNTEVETKKSYIETQYPELEVTHTPVTTETTSTKDIDKDGQLSYFKKENGYIPNEQTTTESAVQTCDNCTADKVTTTYTNDVNLNAESVMDPNLDDYSNNGYKVKVLNPNNHPNALNSESYGPGNLELQHWQNVNTNTSTTTQNWRVVFATDYAIDNAIMKVTLPYSFDGVTSTNSSEWLLSRYYPAVTNNNSVYTSIIVPKEITYENNIATIYFGDIVANSLFSMIFTNTFPSPTDPSASILSSSMNVTGIWNEADLLRQLEEKKEQMRSEGYSEEEIQNAELDYIKSSLTPAQIEYLNEVCVIPTPVEEPPTPEEEITTNPEESVVVTPTPEEEGNTNPEEPVVVAPAPEVEIITNPEEPVVVAPTPAEEVITIPEEPVVVTPVPEEESITDTEEPVVVTPVPEEESITDTEEPIVVTLDPEEEVITKPEELVVVAPNPEEVITITEKPVVVTTTPREEITQKVSKTPLIPVETKDISPASRLDNNVSKEFKSIEKSVSHNTVAPKAAASNSKSTNQEVLPNTGIAETNTPLFSMILAALGGLFLFGRRRKTNSQK